MAKKKSNQSAEIAATDLIENIELSRVMDISFTKYAGKVIEDRAIPDARDGLKPSQRRIIFTMHELGLSPGKKHIKCAKIAGNTSGDYHPHGEAVVYPTLVGMAQDWSMRVPLIDPQGCFGSVDGDPAAAMRYTEARLSEAGGALIDNVSPKVVDYKKTYDDSREEPTVLPAKLPNLLLNGGSGIAVGYATNLPPHNLRELAKVFEAFVNNPNITSKDIIKIMPGPDFPTGGKLLGQEGVYEYYETGRGSLKMEGIYEIKEAANGSETIVVTEFPEGGSPETFRTQIKDLIEKEKIGGITDITNTSSNKTGTCVTVFIGKNGKANVILNQLLHHTCLRVSFSVNNTVLIKGKIYEKAPIVKLIETFINHRKDVLTRKFKAELDETNARIEILDGLLSAVASIDEVIEIIRKSDNPEEASFALISKKIVSTENQAKAVLALTLARLTKLESTSLSDEKKAKEDRKNWLINTLGDEKIVLDIIVKEQKELADKLGNDRRTKIDQAASDIKIADLIDVEDVVVSISTDSYVKRVPLSEYRKQRRGGSGVNSGDLKDDQFVQSMFVASTHDDLLCFTNKGRAISLKVFDLPEATRQSRGRPIVNFINLREDEKICTYLPIKEIEKQTSFLSFVSAHGLVKRISVRSFSDMNRGGLQATKIKEDDRIVTVLVSSGIDDLILVTNQGNAIRFSELDVRISGRQASGVIGVRLDEDDFVIGGIVVQMKFDKDGDTVTLDPDLSMMTITSNGFGKRTLVDEYLVVPSDGSKLRQQVRGGKGRQDINVEGKTGKSVGAIPLKDGNDIVVITKQGQMVRVEAKSIRTLNRGSMGVRLIKLSDGDQILTACPVAEESDIESELETVQS
jgi:DNA gyrase subunit A